MQKKSILKFEGEEQLAPEFVRLRSESAAKPRIFLLRGLLKTIFLLVVIGGIAAATKLIIEAKPWRQMPKTLGVLRVQEPEEFFSNGPEIERANSVRVVYSVKPGDSFSSVTQRIGFSADDGKHLEDAFRGVREQEQIAHILRPGEDVVFEISERAIRAVHARISGGKELYLSRKDDTFTGILRELPAVVRERIATGTMKTTLFAAGLDMGMDYDTIDDLVDLFADRIDFKNDIQVGDTFTVIFREYKLSDGTVKRKTEILAALLNVKGQAFVAVRYVGNDGKARFFNTKGEPIGSYFLRYPLQFSRITSTFTDARFHPVLQRWRPHKGVDFAAPVGTPVRAVADAQVSFAGRNAGSGIMIRLHHNDRYETVYLHLSKIAGGVRTGSRVSRGQVIGAVGMTGLATGPHLHFGFFDRGKYVDPLKVQLPSIDLLSPGQRIDSAYLERVLYTLDHYQRFVPPSSIPN